VRPYSDNGHTFYVMDAAGGPPDSDQVKLACASSGGRQQSKAAELSAVAAAKLSHDHKFLFTFLQRTWDGSPSSFGASV
jgi:hypothetical protein